MLASSPSFERTALGRVTFGATSQDEAYAQQIGWDAWVEEQLAAPAGDDPDLAAFLSTQTLAISYAAAPDNSTATYGATNEPARPFDYLNASTTSLWTLQQQSGNSVAPAEVTRVRQELAAATWIRNTHSKYQLREFMTDFWHNHFNIGKAAHEYATVCLPVYDQQVIRPNVFGNFRQLLQAVATSTSMQGYLDNWLSRAATPNENYSREVLELHTLGGAYLGIVDSTPPSVLSGANMVTTGFTDADVTQASRALSGWTLCNGQFVGDGKILPITGEFAYNPAQHNTKAGTVMGVDLTGMTKDMAQGNAVLDIAAYHPATAAFIVGKLCRRIYGDTPPQTALSRGISAWMQNQSAPDQIKQVLRALLNDPNFPDIGRGDRVKLRRPYEHLIALFRSTGMVVNATTDMTSAFDPVTDFLFAWTPPNGRPDYNAYWLTTGAIMTAWNNSMTWPNRAQIKTTLIDQTPVGSLSSATTVVEYWVGRMVGFALSTSGMTSLVNDQAGTLGVPAAVRGNNRTTIENALKRLVGLISQTPEFLYR